MKPYEQLRMMAKKGPKAVESEFITETIARPGTLARWIAASNLWDQLLQNIANDKNKETSKKLHRFVEETVGTLFVNLDEARAFIFDCSGITYLTREERRKFFGEEA